MGCSFGCSVPLLPLDGTANLRPPESNVRTHRIRFDVHLFAGQPFPGVDLVHAVHGIVRDLRVEEEFQDRRVAGSRLVRVRVISLKLLVIFQACFRVKLPYNGIFLFYISTEHTKVLVIFTRSCLWLRNSTMNA